jgi:SAM-dependent methyltransferase
MPDVTFWRDRFAALGVHSVGPGDTQTEAELEEHRQVFARAVRPWLEQLKGPVLDFGCGVGRWVPDLPRPYIGLDLLPEHLNICRSRYGNLPDVEFHPSSDLQNLPAKSFSSIFTCTVLQHIVEPDLRREILSQFRRLLADGGVLLAVEWAEGQRNYDWCRPVSKQDLKLFGAIPVAQVVESGRKSIVWFCRTRKTVFRFW